MQILTPISNQSPTDCVVTIAQTSPHAHNCTDHIAQYLNNNPRLSSNFNMCTQSNIFTSSDGSNSEMDVSDLTSVDSSLIENSQDTITI